MFVGLTLPLRFGPDGGESGPDQEGEAMRFVRAVSGEETADLLEALKQWDDPSEVRRARAVRLSGKGWTVPRISEALDCTRCSVRRWIDLYEVEGLEGLKTKHRSGRPPKVDEEYRQVLAKTLETAPRELGLAFNRWTLPRLGIYMDKMTGVTVSAGHMSRYYLPAPPDHEQLKAAAASSLDLLEICPGKLHVGAVLLAAVARAPLGVCHPIDFVLFIYGITGGEKLGRGLRRSEIDRKTDWNTYQIPALPLEMSSVVCP